MLDPEKNCTTQKEIWNNPKLGTLESLAKNSNNEHHSALFYCGFQLTPELEGPAGTMTPTKIRESYYPYMFGQKTWRIAFLAVEWRPKSV